MKKAILGLFLGCCGMVSAQDGPIELPVMGWSSWNTYRVNINEELIRKQTDAMVSTGLAGAGYGFVNIDDGFFGWRDEEGNLHTHPERFPDGMKGIADYIHSRGLKAGIYSDAGANTCGSIWDGDKNGIGVGMYGYEKRDAALFFNDWGFDFIKIDYCGAGQQLDLDEEERYTTIRKAIDEVCPRRISINVCRWAYPGTWARNVGRSWRISPDISPDWWSVKAIIEKNLYLSAYAGGGHYNDMDMLEIGRGLTREEEETHFGMWCIMCSPLMVGCDLTTIPEASLKLLKNKELIALNQDRLGLQAYVACREGEGYVLVKDLGEKRGLVRAVALYNPSDTVCRFSVASDVLELVGKLKVRDLVKRVSEGEITGKLEYEVPAHGVKILRVEGERRLEPARYEAEWAYLPCFDDLGKRARGVRYTACPAASGGMVVSNVGGSPENYAEWGEVYSEKGGRYEMAVSYVPAKGDGREIKDRRIEVEVNGRKAVLKELDSESFGKVCTVTLPVELKAGYNVVRMGSARTWTPDIDCFTLKRLAGK